LLGCSADSPQALAKFKAKFKLNFPLLSDPDFELIEALGARRIKSFLGKSVLGIVRSSYLIGPDGRLEKLWENVSAKGHAAQVLEALVALGASPRGASTA